MIRALLVACVLTLCACSPVSAYSSDGGHTNQGCYDGAKSFTVKVVDANGTAVSGATVKGTNRGSGKVLSGTTDDNGVSNAITEAIGAGDIDVKVTQGNRSSALFSTQVTCGLCDCIVTPATATLPIQ